MKTFLAGIVIGLPVGMLLGDAVRGEQRSETASRMRRVWTGARERATGFATGVEDRAREVAKEELQGIGGNAGRNLSELLDEQASEAREQASSSSEAGMERGGEAVLNRVTRQELMSVYGIGPVLADRVLNARPYISDHDVVERGILSETIFDQLRRQLLDKHSKSA